MKREQEVKEILIENTIHLIGEGGFERATTKEITHCGGSLSGLKMNEVYIYRVFGSKEHLYESAFLQLDTELFYAFQRGVRAVGGFENDTKEKLYAFFLRAWRFIMKDEERCRCYVRYHYSVYFKGNSLQAHRNLFGKMIEEIAPIFKDDADVEAILHSVFTTLFDFAIRVYNKDLADTEVNRQHIFNVLYCMMMTYFKDSVKQGDTTHLREGG